MKIAILVLLSLHLLLNLLLIKGIRSFFKRMDELSKSILELYQARDRQKVAALQAFAGLTELTRRLEGRKKFSWTQKDSAEVVRAMEAIKLKKDGISYQKE